MKAAIYARVSTRDKGQSTENQAAQLREFCAALGWQIVAEYQDQESGGHSDRPQFQKMFADAAKRKFDTLVFWSLDRLSREGVLETLQHLNRLTGYGIGWRSFTEQYLDSTGAFKDAVISILATIAKQERIRLSERVCAGLERAKRNGKRLGRPTVSVDAARIGELRQSGNSWVAISKKLGVSVGKCYGAFTAHQGNAHDS
ncbi:MAG TPA: recombinase family protein [Candidatus Acidoferrales bacterium]|nr:recombinase family protein [Candidatus Acidoferrales bacterium]